MKAATSEKYGPPEVVQIREIPQPTPKADEVVVKIHATSVNRTDCGFRSGKPQIVRLFSGLRRPRQTVLGSEFSGEVEAVGSAVSEFKKGDLVFGIHPDIFGAHAEFMCLPEGAAIALKPKNLTHREAAAICEGAWYALNYLKEIDFKKPKNVLVNGASGAIGSAAVQLAKHFGAKVTAVCGTKNVELARSLGADRVVDFEKEDFTKLPETFDVVLDAVGKSTFFRCKKILAADGIYFSTEFGPWVQNVFLALWTPFFSRKKVGFPIPKLHKKDVVFFKELLEAGKYRPVIDRVYPLEQIVEAYKYVETGQKTGSVILSVSGDD